MQTILWTVPWKPEPIKPGFTSKIATSLPCHQNTSSLPPLPSCKTSQLAVLPFPATPTSSSPPLPLLWRIRQQKTFGGVVRSRLSLPMAGYSNQIAPGLSLKLSLIWQQEFVSHLYLSTNFPAIFRNWYLCGLCHSTMFSRVLQMHSHKLHFRGNAGQSLLSLEALHLDTSFSASVFATVTQTPYTSVMSVALQ